MNRADIRAAVWARPIAEMAVLVGERGSDEVGDRAAAILDLVGSDEGDGDPGRWRWLARNQLPE